MPPSMVSVQSLKEINEPNLHALINWLTVALQFICRYSEPHCAVTANVSVKISKLKFWVSRPEEGQANTALSTFRFVHSSHDQQRSNSEHIELTEKAESCKVLLVFFFLVFFVLALSDKQVYLSEILLWHAYSTTPACILAASHSGWNTEKPH